MVQLRSQLLRKRSSVAKLLIMVVAMVIMSSIGMLTLIQRDEGHGSRNSDYQFTDTKYRFGNNEGFDKGAFNDRKEVVNLRMRDTLALPDDYGYNARHNENGNPRFHRSDKDVPPLQKVYDENRELRFEIKREEALIAKENQLREIRERHWDDVILEPIEDENIESDDDTYSYNSEDNENPEFQPDDFDGLPDNIKEAIKVKFDADRNGNPDLSNEDEDDYYDGEDYDNDYDEEDDDGNENESDRENKLNKEEKRVLLDKLISDKYENGNPVIQSRFIQGDAKNTQNHPSVNDNQAANAFISNDHDPVAMAVPQLNGGGHHGGNVAAHHIKTPSNDPSHSQRSVADLLDSAVVDKAKSAKHALPSHQSVFHYQGVIPSVADPEHEKRIQYEAVPENNMQMPSSNRDLLDAAAVKRVGSVKAASNTNTIGSDPCPHDENYVTCMRLRSNETHTVDENNKRENNGNERENNMNNGINKNQPPQVPIDIIKNNNDNALYKNLIETQIPMAAHSNAPVAMEEFPATQLQPTGLRQQQRVDVRSRHGMPLVVNKVYWSEEALALVPKGIDDNNVELFLSRVAHYPVAVMQPATWNKCGRPKNQIVQLADGQAMCARYRLPHITFVTGEVLSFYLSRFLGFDNVPPVALAHVHSNSSQWKRVAKEMKEAEWMDDSLVALIQWIDNIEAHERMPSVILEAFKTKSTFNHTNPTITSMSSLQISDVIQWSDLILFDYLTGNYDRVASMQDGAETEKKPSIMGENIRNLRKDKYSGRLWFIDNESGLLDAYYLMYSRDGNAKFLRYHNEMLRTICLFNPKTVARIRLLAQHEAPHEFLVNYTKEQDEYFKDLPQKNRDMSLLKSRFHTRLKEVLQWVEKCESQTF